MIYTSIQGEMKRNVTSVWNILQMPRPAIVLLTEPRTCRGSSTLRPQLCVKYFHYIYITAKIKWLVLTHVRLPQLQSQYTRECSVTCSALKSLYSKATLDQISFLWCMRSKCTWVRTKYALLNIIDFSFLLELEK